MNRPAAHILIIHVCRIGDTLLGTPAIRAIADRFPTAEITFLGHPKRMELLRHLSFVHHLGGITKKTAPFLGRIPGKRFDYAIVDGFDTALVRYALRVAHKVVAFRQNDESLNRRLHIAVAHPGCGDITAVDLHLLLSEALGAKAVSRALSYQVSGDEAVAIDTLLAQTKLNNSRPLIGMVIESFPTKPYRDWPLERFIELAKAILEHNPAAHFALLGGQISPAKLLQLQHALHNRFVSFAGKLTLRQSAALIARLDLYIGVDTGPTHLAGALQVPMVALYHCMHPAWQLAPLEHPALAVIQQEPPASGKSAQYSLGSIGVEQVLPKALALLAQDNRA